MGELLFISVMREKHVEWIYFTTYTACASEIHCMISWYASKVNTLGSHQYVSIAEAIRNLFCLDYESQRYIMILNVDLMSPQVRAS